MSQVNTHSAPPPIPWQAVWQRDFTLYFLGVVLSLTGFWVRFVAQGWLVYRLTDSAGLLGLVGFFTTLPVIAFAPFAGVIVDRVDRRRLLALTQGSFMIITVLLAWLDSAGLVAVWQILLLSFLGGIVSAFDWPTRLALVPNLVEPAVLQRAVAFNSAAWNGSRIGGPVVAGLLLPVLGTAGSFWAAAAFFVPVLALLPCIRLHGSAPAPDGGGFWENLRGGYRYVLGQPLLMTLLLIELIPTIFGQTVPILMPAIVGEVLQADAAALGWLMASLGAGELIGTLSVALTGWFKPRPSTSVVAVGFFGLMIVLFAQSRLLWLSLLLVVLVGFFASVYATLNGALIQHSIDDHYRGRVMSVYGLIWGLTPIGSAELGGLAELAGSATAVTVNGLIVLLFALALLWRLPRPGTTRE